MQVLHTILKIIYIYLYTKGISLNIFVSHLYLKYRIEKQQSVRKTFRVDTLKGPPGSKSCDFLFKNSMTSIVFSREIIIFKTIRAHIITRTAVAFYITLCIYIYFDDNNILL